MSHQKYQSYHRVHRGPHPLDVEVGKIYRETAQHLKLRRAVERRSPDLLREHDVDGLDEAVADSLHRAEREYRNAREHKRRLRILKSREE